MNIITANELKIKGLSAVEPHLQSDEEVLISVRGKNKYVMMDLDKYTKLREYELAIALQEAKADVAADRYSVGTVGDHLRQISDDV